MAKFEVGTVVCLSDKGRHVHGQTYATFRVQKINEDGTYRIIKPYWEAIVAEDEIVRYS